MYPLCVAISALANASDMLVHLICGGALPYYTIAGLWHLEQMQEFVHIISRPARYIPPFLYEFLHLFPPGYTPRGGI